MRTNIPVNSRGVDEDGALMAKTGKRVATCGRSEMLDDELRETFTVGFLRRYE